MMFWVKTWHHHHHHHRVSEVDVLGGEIVVVGGAAAHLLGVQKLGHTSQSENQRENIKR